MQILGVEDWSWIGVLIPASGHPRHLLPLYQSFYFRPINVNQDEPGAYSQEIHIFTVSKHQSCGTIFSPCLGMLTYGT